MAVTSELHSLNEIQYKSPIKKLFLILIAIMVFAFAFINFYPFGETIKTAIKKALPGHCLIDYSEVKIEVLLPKIVISDLVIPSGCLGAQATDYGPPPSYSFSSLTINWHLISFMPFGLPFRVDTEFSGQPISLYYVLGLTEHTFRLKDQDFKISNFKSFIGGKDIKGNILVDMTATVKGNQLSSLSLKAQSKNFEIPQMTLMEMFTLPALNLKDFYLEAKSVDGRKISVDKFNLGNPDSEIRALFKGKIELQSGNAQFSNLDMTGELAFSEQFLKKIPANEFLGAYTQKDGFYQMRIGGTLGQPMPSPL